MEKPRYWSKELRLSCALEHAVLRIRVFERPEAWRKNCFRLANPADEQSTTTDIEVENGLVLPPEDPLLVARDRVREHQDEAAAGNAVLQCWAALVEGGDFNNVNNSRDDASTPSDKEVDFIGEWPPSRDSLVVFEVFDGVLTVSQGILSGLDLVGEFSAFGLKILTNLLLEL